MPRNPELESPPGGRRPDATRRAGRDSAIDYLRTYLVVNVVLLHAALAYITGMPDRTRLGAVADTARTGMAVALGAPNDLFCMVSLFFISGLFTFPGLDEKGSGGFLVRRLKRLGTGLLLGVFVLNPLAYWPSYLLMDPAPQASYAATYYLGGLTTGPFWFLCVLLTFDAVVALANRLAPTALSKLRRRPSGPVVLLVAIASFVPVTFLIPNHRWVSLGPLSLEPARLGLYFAYFLLGTALGSDRRWSRTPWPRHWGAWCVAALITSAAYAAVVLPVVSRQALAIQSPDVVPPAMTSWPVSVAFAACGASISLFLVGAARRLVRRPYRVLDHLSANSYGVYLFHYAIVNWIQYALLRVSWPANAKMAVAFVGGLALSWGASALVRRIPGVKRII